MREAFGYIKYLPCFIIVIPSRLFIELLHTIFYPMKAVGTWGLERNKVLRSKLLNLGKVMLEWVDK